MLNLAHVRSFLAVVDAGSFLDAARALDCSQPTITQHVRKLEASVNVRLIDRRHERCRPSAAGRRFLPVARRLVDMATHAAQLFTAAPLRIGASGNIGTYLLQPHLRSFAARSGDAPTIDVAIAPNPEVADGLSTGAFDLGLMEWWDNRPGFRAKPWRREELVAIAAPEHPWAQRRTVSVDALLSEPLIGGEPGTGTGRILNGLARRGGTAPDPVLQLGSTEAVKRAVREGLGVSVVFAAAVTDEVAAGTLCARPVAGTRLAKDLFVILPEETLPESPAARFADLLLP